MTADGRPVELDGRFDRSPVGCMRSPSLGLQAGDLQGDRRLPRDNQGTNLIQIVAQQPPAAASARPVGAAAFLGPSGPTREGPIPGKEAAVRSGTR
jgi:hypothetical protein